MEETFQEKQIVIHYHFVEQDGTIISNTLFSNIGEVFRTIDCSEYIQSVIQKVDTYFEENKHVPYFICEAFMEEMTFV